MIFQKSAAKFNPEEEEDFAPTEPSARPDEVETVVGPSVNVEGDFASEGNIIVKGTVNGSVSTSRYLLVEPGAKIVANVRAGSAKIAGEVSGNLKVTDSLELTSTARLMGDIEAKVLAVEAGALMYGKVAMPGLEGMESARSAARTRTVTKKNELSSSAV